MTTGSWIARIGVATAIVLGLSGSASAADDVKLDENFLIGNWTIKYVTAKGSDSLKKTIEFKDDGTFNWDNAGFKMEGTYKLKGTTLEITKKGDKKPTLQWEKLSIKDGKLIHPVGKTSANEFTRVEKKDK